MYHRELHVTCGFIVKILKVRHGRRVGVSIATDVWVCQSCGMCEYVYVYCFLQVRHDRRVGTSSAVRFLTDGVLMRQLQADFLLRTYSIILLDEAHERSLNTDLLLGECWLLLPEMAC